MPPISYSQRGDQITYFPNFSIHKVAQVLNRAAQERGCLQPCKGARERFLADKDTVRIAQAVEKEVQRQDTTARSGGPRMVQHPLLLDPGRQSWIPAPPRACTSVPMVLIR